jgi:hypothetical protein
MKPGRIWRTGDMISLPFKHDQSTRFFSSSDARRHLRIPSVTTGKIQKGLRSLF